MHPLILLISLIIVQTNSQHIWHSYQHKSFHQSREEFLITNVTHDENFKLNYEIAKWKSLQLKNISYAVGFKENRAVLVVFQLNSKGNGFDFKSNNRLELGSEAVDVSLFSYWNKSNKKHDLITVIATNELELLWYRVEEINLIPIWKWQLNKNITHLNHFEINHNHHLLVISEHLNQFTLDIYEFELNNFWLHQTIPLTNSTKSSAISYFNDNYFLSIPQNSSLIVYKLTQNRFVFYKNITSLGLDQVVAFSIGSKSFLAINGFRAGIYQFTKNGLVGELVVNSNLNGINYWLPIPIGSYQLGELVLLAQRRLIHGQHKSFVIEVITYNNGKEFEEHEDIPCNYFGESTENLQCLVEEESLNGIINGVPVSLGRVLALLVPRENRSSELFMMESTIRKVPSPVERETKELLERKKYLEELLLAQEIEFHEIRANLEQIGEESELVLNTPQTQPKLFTSKAHQEKKVSNFRVLPKTEELLDLETIKTQMETYGREIAAMKAKFDEMEDNENQTHFETIIINGLVEMEGVVEAEEVETQEIGGESANKLLDDLVLREHLQLITSPKIFTNLQVDGLNFEQVNSISAEELVYEDTITINSDLIVEEILKVAGDVKCEQINGLRLEDEVVNFNEPNTNTSLHFEGVLIEDNIEIELLNGLPLSHESPMIDIRLSEGPQEIQSTLELDTVFIPNNATVKTINGEDFDQILHQLCLTNIVCYIPGQVKILEDAYVNGDVDIEFLNGLVYPDNYLFQSGNNNAVVTGEKYFQGAILITRGLFSIGFINGINPKEIVTLSTEQTIPGKTTIENLEIKENITVLGDVNGKRLDQLIPNQPLTVVNHIRSSVYFTSLDVEGDIILSGNFGKNNFESILSNIIYKDEDNPVIQSLKEFPAGFTVETDLALESNSIGVIPLDLFLTKTTNQAIKGQTINGDVVFGNLHLSGSYGGFDVRKLDQDLVKLSGQQFISAKLDFEGEIEVENLEIVRSLNDLSSDEYLFTDDDRQLTHVLEFDGIQVDNLFIDYNLSAKFDDFDLEEFEANRMSWSKDQVIEGTYTIESSEISDIHPSLIDDIIYEQLFDYGKFLDRVSVDLVLGKLKVKNLHVNGSIQINDLKITNLQIFKNSFKNIRNLEITGTAFFDRLEITNLSNVNFDKFVKNLVYKNETNLTISDTKIFENGFSVEELIETKSLNQVPIENILTKRGPQTISGPITVFGDVIFSGEMEVTENVNDFPISYFLENFQVTADGKYKIKDEMLFNRLTFIQNLQIKGFANGKKVQKHLESLVYKTDDIKISGQTVFRNRVEIGKNLAINNTLNGIILSAFASNVVDITSDVGITSMGIFTQPITVQKQLVIDSNLVTNYLDGIDLNVWKNDAVLVNQGFLPGHYIFEDMVINDVLYTELINSMNVSNLIPLRTNQSLERLHFEKLMPIKDVVVGNTVNGLNLTKEYSNTLMNGLEQEITSNLLFTGRVFAQNLTIEGQLNHNDFSRIVTTNTDQNLTATYNFSSKTILESDLFVFGSVNGVNLTNWHKRNLQLASADSQNINEEWVVDGGLVFQDNVEGNGTINGLDLRKLKEQIEEKRNYKYSVERNLIENYINLCKDVNYLYEGVKRQIYKFQYLETLQYLDIPDLVQNVHHFQYGNSDYLLISEGRSCLAHLLVFRDSAFFLLFDFEMGIILQTISVSLDNRTLLVTRNLPGNCLEGTNIWEFEGNGFKLVTTLENQNLLQDSSIPGTFYGLDHFGVTEFKLTSENGFNCRKYRRWAIQDDNLAFVPRGLGTGLALRTGTQLIRLLRNDHQIDDRNDLGNKFEGEIVREPNNYLPSGQTGNDLVVLKVGTHKQPLLAVASHEETSVKGRLDFIKIYEDVINGRLFHKVPTTKPSGLVSMEFDNGETLLVFLEDEKTLQVYEYKGIEGFKHRISAKLEGSKLFSLTLKSKQKVLGLINKGRVTIIEAEMLGNQVEENLKCPL